MKTAEEIQKRLCKDSCDIGITEIKAIQDDAIIEGMRMAVEINHKWSANRPMASKDIDCASRDIKTAIENLKGV